MAGKISIVDVDLFFDRYIPSPPKKEPTEILSTLQWTGPPTLEDALNSKAMINTFNTWITSEDAEAAPCPGVDSYKVVVTTGRDDSADETKQRADLALYPTHAAPDQTEQPNWSAVEVFIDCKPEPTQDDPFDDKADNFLPSSERRRRNFCQIMLYASTIFQSQHRKHQFSVVLLGDMARIIHWDRSGVVATEKFNYREEPSKLSRFFWRLCHMSAAQRGHDTTVKEIHTDTVEYELMMLRAEKSIVDEATGIELGQHARLLFAESLKNTKMCYKIKVPDGGGERSFLVGAPHFLSTELAGRGTRGYVAIDCSDPKGPFVYIKDAWRVDRDGLEPEGNVLQYLNKEGVQGVPTLVCHGDIEGQVTNSQEVWKTVHPDREECPLKVHRHYRIVVKEVGLSMSCFRNAEELVFLIATCIEAHGRAYEKGVLHRDVSAGNVLICIKEEIVDGRLVQKRTGMLTDWELSKRTNVPGTAHQPGRIGTWEFMSAYILNNPDMAIELPDELEAFVHVLLYYAIRFLRHNCKDVGEFIRSYFRGYVKDGGDYFCGLAKREAMGIGRINLAGDKKLVFYYSDVAADDASAPTDHPSSSAVEDKDALKQHPLTQLLDALLQCFKARYALLKLPAGGPPIAAQQLHSPTDAIEAMFAKGYNKNGSIRATVEEVGKSSSAEPNSESYKKYAAKLNSHETFYDLVGSFVLRYIWPNNDKVQDQLGEDMHPKEEDKSTSALESMTPPTIPTASQIAARTRSGRTMSLGVPPPTASGSSGKRFNRDHDGEDDEYAPPSAKRSRLQNSGVGSRRDKGSSRA
ncbi:hypothetical protein L226DRAFT_490916 [Lentinus tigrinus ALCF2SS1-7]|uniref:Fungal-type protein kinase domain-containing protein n=1 Tax=Lentinus tigrinus ALCF2SS1-6 TaxID=1328759 RepID=A0A5C2S2M6_9APHY|nr:hypothetical protein L227DRAFT_655287 [Lentinus tigrinus ALCF2SS1-6]RPD71902.1 hypothetical protein L226DRAFT_490916 [Lentinus tigrinus ALCF2SS1-7]